MTRRSMFSQSWHNVAELKPRLMPFVRIYRHVYRGQPWFVVQDSAGGRYHRLSSNAYSFVRRMNGSTTIQELWDQACKEDSAYVPTQDEIVELLMKLYTNDLLDCDVTPDSAEIFERYRKRRLAKWKQWFTNPLSLKIPLLDPDSFLNVCAGILPWVFSTKGIILWMSTVIPALVLAGMNWQELTGNISDRVLASNNIIILLIVYPFIKAAHEIGHGIAAKVWGGSVHEAGLMFLVFAPVPYVDASSASSFRSKYQRAIVGAAGILVELFIAALAMYIWALIEPGTIRAIAYNILFIAGVSTLLINGNPLLKFDGYFVLTDLIEIPNLAQRGKSYLTFLCDRYLFGATDLDAPKETPSEKRWLVIYTISAWIYRVFVTIAIILFVGSQFFIFGVLIALWSTFTLIVTPIWKAYKHITESGTLHRHRERTIKTASLLLAGSILVITLLPMPLRTQSEGIVWLPDEAIVRTESSGFVRHWLIEPGSQVQNGTPLLEMEDPLITAEFQSVQARFEEAMVRYKSVQFTDLVQANIEREILEHEQNELDRISQRKHYLIVYSKTNGLLTVAKPHDIDGQYVKQGETVGYILDKKQLIARVAVLQDDIDLVQSHLKGAEIRFADDISQSHKVSVLRQVPGAVDELPTAALSPAGGGTIAVDPQDSSGLKTVDRIFLIDLTLPQDVPPSAFGERVYVRFDHHWEPLLSQWYRRIRQLLLGHFYA